MKIIFVLPDMPGGGSERVVALLANEYIERGYEVGILLFAGNTVAYPLHKDVEVFVAGKASGGNPFIRIKRLYEMRRYFKKNKGAYVFSFCVMGTVFTVLTAIGIKHFLLVSERNDPTRIPHQKLRNWAYRKAHRLVFQTKDMQDLFPKDISEKSAVIPNPVSSDIRERYEGERKKWVVSVGRLEAQKNHRLLLEAYADFVQEYPDYELHVFGIGELKDELVALGKSLGIESKIVWEGFSPTVKEEIWDAAMYVLSSDYEGISNSMIEALAMGVPVISTDCPVGGSAEYISHMESGMLVPVGDKTRMTEAMKMIASNQGFADKISNNAAKIREQYSLSIIATRFLEEAGLTP